MFAHDGGEVPMIWLIDWSDLWEGQFLSFTKHVWSYLHYVYLYLVIKQVFTLLFLPKQRLKLDLIRNKGLKRYSCSFFFTLLLVWNLRNREASSAKTGRCPRPCGPWGPFRSWTAQQYITGQPGGLYHFCQVAQPFTQAHFLAAPPASSTATSAVPRDLLWSSRSPASRRLSMCCARHPRVPARPRRWWLVGSDALDEREEEPRRGWMDAEEGSQAAMERNAMPRE